MGVQIVTNNTPRRLLDWAELSEAERADFDWIESPEESGESFFRYQGRAYALPEFMRAGEAFPGWAGYLSDTYFSGVLIRFPEGDFESVICGRYCA